MTNNEPEFNKLGAVPVQLSFFYNSFTKEIPFSSSSPDSFFETSLDPAQEPSFLNAFEGSTRDLLTNEWLACLQLKENETRNFTISKSAGKQPLNFSFTVMRPPSSLLAGSSLFVISVARTAASSLLQPGNESPSSFHKEYDELIELAAHDLDSPLRKLSMLIDRITSKYETITDKDTQGYILRARACLADMRSMIDGLTLLSRLGSVPVQKKNCHIESIVRSVLNDLQEKAGEEKIVVSTGVLPVLQGDSAQYRQLFKSLLENAWKFRKKEIPGQIEIFSEAVTDKEKQSNGLRPENSYLKIIVADNGVGFKQEYAEKIFQPFVRLNGKSEYPGNGIGLALCKKIVENHCGIIDVESEENFGARFSLILPVSPD